MSTITLNTQRVGNFTSSKIYNLLTNGRAAGSLGKPALTYIAERNMERRLQRSIDTESNARPLTWGNLAENYVGQAGLLDEFGEKYRMCSQETKFHPIYDYWSGSADGLIYENEKVIGIFDIKSPMTLKSFCGLVDPLYVDGLSGIDHMNQARQGHADAEKYYWQLVSNCAIHEVKYAELIVFCPYLSELEALKEFAGNLDVPDTRPYFWISAAEDYELPYLVDNSMYENITKIGFEIPQEDFDALEQRVILCGAHLIKR
jgi:hypothetical protein